MSIHSTAVVDPKAQLADDVSIGPYCVIGPNVKLAKGVTLKSHVVIDGHTEVGEGTVIYPFTSLGSPPQDLKFEGENSKLVIGKNNTIREHVTMNPGTKGGGMITKVGDNNLFMVGVHIAHDCVVGSHIVMANNATLGGHVHVGDHAIIGGLCGVHQFVRIGQHAMIGAMSAVMTDVIPYGLAKGERAFLAGLNLIGLERRGFTRDQVKALQKAFMQLFGDQGTLEERVNAVASDFANDEHVQNIIRFAREKEKFALCQPQK